MASRNPVSVRNYYVIQKNLYHITLYYQQITCRECVGRQNTFLNYGDFRAHLRVEHGRREFNFDAEIRYFETWTGSQEHILRRQPNNSRSTAGPIWSDQINMLSHLKVLHRCFQPPSPQE